MDTVTFNVVVAAGFVGLVWLLKRLRPRGPK